MHKNCNKIEKIEPGENCPECYFISDILMKLTHDLNNLIKSM